MNEKEKWQLIDFVGEYRVSTVELQFVFDRGFETMVFFGESWSSNDCQRYETKEAAILGHKEMVEKWTEKVKNWEKK